jgi:hypothetical protein
MARLNDDDRRKTIETVASAVTTPKDLERAAYLVDTADDILDRIADKGHGAAVATLALCLDQFGAQMPASYRARLAQRAQGGSDDPAT